MTATVGVVVPAFRPSIEQLRAYVRELDDELSPAAIRIELDDPDDGVESALEDLPATVNAVDRRRGKGRAVTEGFQALETDVLAFADADGSTAVGSFADVVDPVRDDEAVLSVGSRRHPAATIRSHQTVARRWLGDGFAWLARRLLDADLYDYQCGAKAISQDGWQRVREHLYEPGFAWDIELVAMAAALELSIVEVPVDWEDKPGSTVAPIGTAVELGVALLSARHRARRLREDPLHVAIASHREERTALVERGRARDD